MRYLGICIAPQINRSSTVLLQLQAHRYPGQCSGYFPVPVISLLHPTLLVVFIDHVDVLSDHEAEETDQRRGTRQPKRNGADPISGMMFDIRCVSEKIRHHERHHHEAGQPDEQRKNETREAWIATVRPESLAVNTVAGLCRECRQILRIRCAIVVARRFYINAFHFAEILIYGD